MNGSSALRFCLLIASLARTPSAHAVDADIQFECLGIDGIPISSDTAQATSCCANGQLIANPPATCRAGFNSITASAAIGAAMSVNLAQKTLETAHDLNGATVLYDSPQPDQASNLSDSSSQPSTSAITARGLDLSKSGSDFQNSGTAEGLNSGGSASQTSRLGGSASASASGLPQTSVNSNLGQSKPDSAGVAGDGGQSTFSKLENGVGSELKFGDVAAHHSGEKFDSPGDLQFPGGPSKNANESGSGRDPSAQEGSETDPADYFSRIDRSASLFEVVSRRYLKVSARAGTQ